MKDYCSNTGTGCTPATCSSTFYCSNALRTWGGGSTGYNDAGDLTTKGTFTMSYDAWNRLIYVKWSNIFLSYYYYNGLNQKIQRTDAALPNMYYYYGQGSQMLEERKTSDGSVYSSYIWGTQYIDDLAVHNLSGATKYVALDHNSNCVTRLDSTGNAETRFLYDKYGNPTQRSADWGTTQTIVEDHYLFTGRQWHKDPLKYDFRNRDQDPELSSFIQPDSIGNWGDKANFGNRYAYVANDPVNQIDPAGHECHGQYEIQGFGWGRGLWKNGIPPVLQDAMQMCKSSLRFNCDSYCDVYSPDCKDQVLQACRGSLDGSSVTYAPPTVGGSIKVGILVILDCSGMCTCRCNFKDNVVASLFVVYSDYTTVPFSQVFHSTYRTLSSRGNVELFSALSTDQAPGSLTTIAVSSGNGLSPGSKFFKLSVNPLLYSLSRK